MKIHEKKLWFVLTRALARGARNTLFCIESLALLMEDSSFLCEAQILYTRRAFLFLLGNNHGFHMSIALRGTDPVLAVRRRVVDPVY